MLFSPSHPSTFWLRRLWRARVFLLLGLLGVRVEAAGYTRLQPLPAPRIVAASEAHPNGHTPLHLTDGDPKTQYISASKGVQTFVEFDFGRTVQLAAFRHQDRASSATVARSELVGFDDQGREVARVAVVHSGETSGITMHAMAPAIPVRRVRWQITELGGARVGTVGGTEITFFEAGKTVGEPVALTLAAVALPIAQQTESGLQQALHVTIDYPYAESVDARLSVGELPPQPVRLVAGAQTVELAVPVSSQARNWKMELADANQRVFASQSFAVPPFRELTIYVLPHSHVDIGYTESQADVEEKQVNNLLAGIAAARKTADYPAGARFVWNLEGVWPADLLLRRLGPERHDEFLQAVKSGQVALNGMYANTLTGLCRPEELVRVFRFGTELSARIGVPIDSAMISDVPGYTWGTVPAMAQAGIRYFSAAPNYFDRIGDILVEWENKPFWWVGPSGKDRVLVWVPSSGYALAHIIRRLSPRWLVSYADELVRTGYAYDVAYIRWAGQGDNGVPDLAISEFVKTWNASHAWPRFVIGSVHDAFQALEQKHGAQLPEVRGDWTPYWEDGAGSSARETAMNRANSDRLAQAEALWAMRAPRRYPREEFAGAMQHVLLYDEHTWGASRSVSAPNHSTTLEQWATKSAYAATADTQSRDLLARGLSGAVTGAAVADSVDVFNTNSWTRTGLVTLSKDMAVIGDRVSDEQGGPVPSQRLTTGELVLLASDVPAFGARRYRLSAGRAHEGGKVAITDATLDNGLVKVGLDPQSGDIVELRARGVEANLAQPEKTAALNGYLSFNGDDPSKARRSGAATLRVKERGPLVASLLVESTAPGAFTLTREVKLVAGADHVEIENFIDKQRLVATDYRLPEGKESVNFAFPFNVPGGQMRLEVPFGVMRPDQDQIPGSCKNWLTVNRWADVSNADYGVTWVSRDTPLVQVGGLTANLLNSQTNPAVWRKAIEPTQALYAWVMNNHWGTNYRAYQEGPHTFRFVLRPHAGYDPAAASRLAIAASQPLLAVRSRGEVSKLAPTLSVESPDVVVTGLKPSDDGKALIVRLWGAAGKDVETRLMVAGVSSGAVSLSDTSERPLQASGDKIKVPAWGLVTLRVELP
ncbi:glycoside hydrolase family 38 C-terminal domain-containing protein [Oleiharenicola lentus]|uniref:glycoside hydrolase family 38 N-terminal domain-containing protein n=1 Tax=Oleiharenicola lentus TaxID=2508720 RepID=UPI003F66938D